MLPLSGVREVAGRRPTLEAGQEVRRSLAVADTGHAVDSLAAVADSPLRDVSSHFLKLGRMHPYVVDSRNRPDCKTWYRQ